MGGFGSSSKIIEFYYTKIKINTTKLIFGAIYM